MKLDLTRRVAFSVFTSTTFNFGTVLFAIILKGLFFQRLVMRIHFSLSKHFSNLSYFIFYVSLNLNIKDLSIFFKMELIILA